MWRLRAPSTPIDHVDPRAESAMARILLDDETLVVAQRQHWAAVAGPVSMAVVGLVLTLVAGFSAPARLGILTNLTWYLWFILLAYAGVRLLMWRIDWFAATDKRLLMTYGVINRRVAMMPLLKVTDMSFNRNLFGQVLGYGQFILESAGQDQAMRQIDFVRDSKATYLAIVGEIFGEDPDEAESDETGDETDPFLHLQLAAARTSEADPTDVPVRPIGFYLPRPERPRRNGLRNRILRGAKDEEPPPAFGHEGDVGWPRREPPHHHQQQRDPGDD